MTWPLALMIVGVVWAVVAVAVVIILVKWM